MKTNRFLVLACVSLAMSFTFSCSSGDDGEGGGSSSPSGGCTNPSSYNSFNEVKIGGQVWMKENLNYAACGSKCYGEGGVVRVRSDETDDDGDPIYDFITLTSSEIQANCAKYGRLYDWTTAMALPSKCIKVLSTSDPDCAINTPHHRGICPSGWHIPSNDEWDALYRYADGEYVPDYNRNPADYGNVHRGGSETAGGKLKATSGWNDDEGQSGNGRDTYGFAALPGGLGDYSGLFARVGYFGWWWSSGEYDSYDYMAYYRLMLYNHDGAGWDIRQKHYLLSIRCIQD